MWSKPRRLVSAWAAPMGTAGGRYATRIQAERTIALARVGLAATSLFAIWLDPAQPERYVALTYGLLAAYLLYAVALAVTSWNRQGRSRLPIVTHVVDIFVFSVFQYFALGPSNPFFVYFVFSLFCGALRWGPKGTLVTAVAVLVSFLTIGEFMGLAFGADVFELKRFFLRAAYLGVAATMLVYLGRHEAQLHAQIERLAGWPSVTSDNVEDVVRLILSHAATIVSAPRVVAVWEREEEPWRYVATWSASQFVLTRHAPDDFEPLVPSMLTDAAFLATEPLGDASIVVMSRSHELAEWQGRPVHADLLSGGDRAGLLSAPFHAEHLTGRIFLRDLLLPTPELLPLTEVIAREVGGSLAQLHVTRRLADVAAREERIRVARDLHDGVLQSLTGLRLELESVAAGPGDDLQPATRDHLLNIERALATEQRELRLFISGLHPTSAAQEREGSLAGRLESVRSRLALQWKMPVSIRIGSCPAVLRGALMAGVPLMVQEAVINALKHGRPTRVQVDLDTEGDRLCLVVTDDGRGFAFRGRYDDADLARMNAGPLSLRARVAELGGKIAIESTASGSRVEIALPMREEPY